MAILSDIMVKTDIYLKNNILKRLILRHLFPIVTLLLLTGCYEDFTPDIETEPVLCLNSLIIAGEPVEVKVTHTWLYTDIEASKDHTVDDAVIKIMVNGEAVRPDYRPGEGDHVQIIADSKTYGHAEAEVTVPYTTPIKAVRFTPTLTDSWHSQPSQNPNVAYQEITAQFRFDISIEMEMEDIYPGDDYFDLSTLTFNYDGTNEEELVPLSSHRQSEFYPGSLKYEAEPIFGEHIGVFESIMANDTYSTSFFTDRQFSGSSYTLHLNYTDAQYTITMSDRDTDFIDCGYTLTLRSISKSYYDLGVYTWHNNEGPLGDMADMGLGDPIWGYSNVSTGAGVVAAMSSASYTLDLKPFLTELVEATLDDIYPTGSLTSAEGSPGLSGSIDPSLPLQGRQKSQDI